MISLPGLTLFTGRSDIAKSILRNFARHTDHGHAAEPLCGFGREARNSTPWTPRSGSLKLRARMRRQPTITILSARNSMRFSPQIIDFHIKGTRYNINVTKMACSHAGAPGVQLTWMDAKIGDWVVTPRSGKPVEIQALWYNALRVMEDLAARFERRRAAEEIFAAWRHLPARRSIAFSGTRTRTACTTLSMAVRRTRRFGRTRFSP